MKFMPSTTGIYKAGIGRTITRANIAAIEAKRDRDKLDPIETAEKMLDELVPPRYQEARHLRRIRKLCQDFLVQKS